MSMDQEEDYIDPLYDVDNDDFGDREIEDFPEYIDLFSTKCSQEEKTALKFAGKLVIAIIMVIVAVFYFCLKVFA